MVSLATSLPLRQYTFFFVYPRPRSPRPAGFHHHVAWYGICPVLIARAHLLAKNCSPISMESYGRWDDARNK